MVNFGVTRRKERNPEREGIKWKSGNLLAVFIASVLIHLFDASIQMSRANFKFMAFLYFFLAVWAFFAIKGSRKDQEEYEYSNSDYEMRHHVQTPKRIILFAILFFFSVFVPMLLGFVDSFNIHIGEYTLLQIISFVLIFIPVWPLYISSVGCPKITHFYINAWIVIIVGYFAINFIITFNSGALAEYRAQAIPIDEAPILNALIDTAQSGYKAFVASFRTVKFDGFFLKLANATGLRYYYGMGDQSDTGPVGLYLSNVRAIERYFYEDSPVVIWADIRGKSFTREIHATPGCYIDKIGEGVAEPANIYILGEEHDTISCTFDSLPKGTYRAKVGVSFNFETWAYVTYTFVDQEIIRSLSIQGKSVNSQLDVSPMPEAVYSNGPVMLGMGSMVDQPIGVDRQANVKEPVLGVTLDNNLAWSEGRIKTPVHEFEIQVPDDFELVKCDRWKKDEKREPYKKEENYNFYKFTQEDLSDNRAEFTSITCRLHILNPAELLKGAQKVQRTFVARASYDYVLEHPLSITVRE